MHHLQIFVRLLSPLGLFPWLTVEENVEFGMK